MASLSFGRTKRRLLSTFILALGLVVQPFSMVMASTAYAAPTATVCAAGCDFTTLQAAVDGVDVGGVVTLMENVTTNSQVTISKALTINGNSRSVTPTFTKTDNSNNAVFGVTATSGVTLSNMTIDGAAGTNLHGVNVYESTGVVLNSLVVNNNDRYAVVVNSSDVAVDSINTSGNGWGGINVDQVTQPAQVTMSGVNSHTETYQLYTEGVGASMVDNTTNHQYIEYPAGSGLYTIDASAGSVRNTTTHKAFDTIQAAIDHSSTMAGDVIAIEAGSYAETVTVTKAVTLNGPNAGVNPVTGVRGAEAVLTGQVIVYAGNVTVDGLTITNPSYSGVTIKGIHVWSSAGISNVTLKNNILTAITNANTKGSYGIMVQGAVSNATVTNNLFSNITSAGWAHAIEVTPASGVVATPSNVTVTGNSISGTSNTAGNDQYDFSLDKAGSVSADASEVIFSGNSISGNVRNLDTVNTLDASSNWWGNTNGPSTSQRTGDVTVAPWCTWSDCSALATDEPLVLPVSGGVAQVVSDMILDNSSATDNVRAVLPGGTTVTSDPSWDGTIDAPAVTSFTVPGAASTGLAITVGSNDHTLSFNHAVQLFFPGQGGKSVGFKTPTGNFTEITATCVANDPGMVDGQLVAPLNDCKMTYGNDLIVWTKHFTTFATYTPLAAPATGNTSSTSTTRPGNFFSETVYDDTWMDGANTTAGETYGDVKSGNVGVSGTATVNDDLQEVPAKGISWYWWLLGGVLAAGAWSLVSLLRSGRFNR